MGKYHFPKNNSAMLPLVVRAMQNNFPSSIDSIGFEHDGDEVYFTYTEGEVSYRLAVGFTDFKESVIEVQGEKYVVRVIGEAMEDEDRNMLYKLELLFPELPNTRMIKLSFTEEDQLLVRMSEMPNEKIANVFLKEMNGTNPKLSAYMDMIEKRIGKNTANKRLIDTFAPKLVGARIGSDSYGRIMDEERERQKGSERTSRVIDGIIDKLLRDDDGDDDGPFAFFGEIVDRIKLRIPQKGKAKEIADNGEREE